MTRSLPPFAAVKAFEAAARLGSFAQAAGELGVTATAISQHVKGLERWSGLTLFTRRANRVVLTEDGEALIGDVTRILDELAHILPRAKENKAQNVTVRLQTHPAFAVCWLQPRLPAFHASNSGVEIDLQLTASPSFGPRSQANLAISYGEAIPAGAIGDHLAEDEILPVSSPDYCDLLGLQDPHNWKNVTLLIDDQWPGDVKRWNRARPEQRLDERSAAHFAHHGLALMAARDSLGILLAHRALVSEQLASGTLVSLTVDPLPTGKNFMLLRRQGHLSTAEIQLRGWLLTNIRQQ
jgi:LysR family transcriptional regulator, glycine cleavage system transcriptional activator